MLDGSYPYWHRRPSKTLSKAGNSPPTEYPEFVMYIPAMVDQPGSDWELDFDRVCAEILASLERLEHVRVALLSERGTDDSFASPFGQQRLRD